MYKTRQEQDVKQELVITFDFCFLSIENLKKQNMKQDRIKIFDKKSFFWKFFGILDS